MQDLLAGNYLASAKSVSTGFVPVIDPTLSIASQIGPTATGGTFTINGAPVTYTAGQSIDSILSQLNSISGVNAVFNDTTYEFEIYSNTPLTYAGTGGDNFKWAHLESFLVSTMPINDPNAENQAQVEYGAEALNANYATPPTGPNSLAFLIMPSSTGVITVNGVQVPWNNTQSLNTIFSSTAPFIPYYRTCYN